MYACYTLFMLYVILSIIIIYAALIIQHNKKNVKSKHPSKKIKKPYLDMKLLWILGIFGFFFLIELFSEWNTGGSKGVSCKLSYANSSYCNYSCTKGDRALWVPASHPNPSAYMSPSNSGCPGWPPNLTEKQFDAAAK